MTGAGGKDHALSVSAAVTIGDQALIHCEFETKGRGVLALYGRSGAGKSTLLKMLFGLYHADNGDILVCGQVQDFTDPSDAMAAGIGRRSPRSRCR